MDTESKLPMKQCETSRNIQCLRETLPRYYPNILKILSPSIPKEVEKYHLLVTLFFFNLQELFSIPCDAWLVPDEVGSEKTHPVGRAVQSQDGAELYHFVLGEWCKSACPFSEGFWKFWLFGWCYATWSIWSIQPKTICTWNCPPPTATHPQKLQGTPFLRYQFWISMWNIQWWNWMCFHLGSTWMMTSSELTSSRPRIRAL